MSGGGDDYEDDELDWVPLGMRWIAPAQYPQDQLMEEAAFIAYHFHWDIDRILGLEHGERRRWADEISRINTQINDQSGALASL